MSAALPSALRARFQEYIEEGLSGRAAAGVRWQRRLRETGSVRPEVDDVAWRMKLSERGLSETEFRRCVRSWGGQVRSFGSARGRQFWPRFSDFRSCAPLAWTR